MDRENLFDAEYEWALVEELQTLSAHPGDAFMRAADTIESLLALIAELRDARSAPRARRKKRKVPPGGDLRMLQTVGYLVGHPYLSDGDAIADAE